MSSYLSHAAHSYQEGWGLVQTGGFNHLEIDNSPGHDIDTVDFSSGGEAWELLPTRIPDGARHGHCQISLDRDSFLIAGGHKSGIAGIADLKSG